MSFEEFKNLENCVLVVDVATLEVLYLSNIDAQSTKSDVSFYSPTKDVRTGCPDTPSEA